MHNSGLRLLDENRTELNSDVPKLVSLSGLLAKHRAVSPEEAKQSNYNPVYKGGVYS